MLCFPGRWSAGRRGGRDHVPEQQRGGAGADPAGDGGERDSLDVGGGRVDVADEAAVRRGVGPDVDHGGAGGDVTGADQPGAADGRDQDVGLAGDGGQVDRPRVADGDGGVPVEQQVGGGLADHYRAAHHDRVPTPQLHLIVVEQGEHRLGG